MRLLALLLAAALHHTKAETGNAYHGPPQSRELFTYNNRLYYFYSDKVAWEEANSICEAGEMHLATLDDPGKAKFAAQSIAEAWMVFEDMWIGGKKGEQGKWVWTTNGQKIPEDLQQYNNDSFLYPPWVDDEVPDREGKDCLAVDRSGHNDPYFVDLACKVRRPFICEAKGKDADREPTEGPRILINKVEYILFHGRLSWSAAVSYCRQEGFTLASIVDMDVAKKVAKTMLKARPEFEDAWIGASFRKNIWQWINEDEIKEIPPILKNESGLATSDNIVTPQFPPWFELDPSNGKTCVIFDRHLCDVPTFITLKCNRQRDFICMKVEERDDSEEAIIVDTPRKRYIFFPVQATWNDAYSLCETEGAKMLILEDMSETRMIMQMMADAKKPIDHLWIAGRIVAETWRWRLNDNIDEDKNPIIPTKMDSDGFPPWCFDNEAIDIKSSESCLNLDRQNHLTPLIYGLECNATQGVVCTMNTTAGDILVNVEPNKMARATVLTEEQPISGIQAETVCHNEVGELWLPSFLKSDDEVAASLIAKTQEYVANQKEALSDDRIKKVYHVLGKISRERGGNMTLRYTDPVNNRTKREVGIPAGTLTGATTGQCVVGEIDSTSKSFKWAAVDCFAQLYSQILCIPICPLEQIPYAFNATATDWECQAGGSKIFDHKMKNMKCTQKCHGGRILQGPALYQCSDRGWIQGEMKVKEKLSQCVDNATAFKQLQEKANSESVTKLGMVIDSSSGTPHTHQVNKYFLAAVASVFAAKSEAIEIHVVSMEARDESPSMAFNFTLKFSDPNCAAVLEPLLNLTDYNKGFRDFGAALDLLRTTFSSDQTTTAVTVFTTPESNQKNDYKSIARELQKVSTVFAVGVTKYVPVSQLVSIASREENIIHSIAFNTPNNLYWATQALLDGCANCKCKPEMKKLIPDELWVKLTGIPMTNLERGPQPPVPAPVPAPVPNSAPSSPATSTETPTEPNRRNEELQQDEQAQHNEDQ